MKLKPLPIGIDKFEKLIKSGAYPVINLDFKEGKQGSYEESYACICKNIVAEYTRHLHVISYQALTAAEIFVGFIRR